MSSLASGVDPDETLCGISSGSTLFAKTKRIFREINVILFGSYYMPPHDIYN